MSNLQANTKYIRRKFALMVKMTVLSSGPGFGIVSILSSQSLVSSSNQLLEMESNQVSDASENYSNPPWQQQKYVPKDVLLKKIVLLLCLVCDLKYEVT